MTGYACSERCTLGFIPTWQRGVGYIILPASQLYHVSQHTEWSLAFMSHNIKPTFTGETAFPAPHTHHTRREPKNAKQIPHLHHPHGTEHIAKTPLLLTTTDFCNIFHRVVCKLFTPMNQLTAHRHRDVERQGIAAGNL